LSMNQNWVLTTDVSVLSGVVPDREVAPTEVEIGVDQQLERELRSVVVACEECNHSSQVSTRTVPGYGEPARIPAELACVCRDPGCRGIRGIRRRGELVLRSQRVFDRNDDAAGCVRQCAGQGIVGVEITEHEAAAVEEHGHRQQSVRTRSVYAHVDRAGGRVDRAVLAPGDRFAGGK